MSFYFLTFNRNVFESTWEFSVKWPSNDWQFSLGETSSKFPGNCVARGAIYVFYYLSPAKHITSLASTVNDINKICITIVGYDGS